MSFLVEEQTEQEVRHHTIWAEKYRPSKLDDYVGKRHSQGEGKSIY